MIDIFETQNISLASFLILQGIKFKECRSSESNSRVVLLVFEDPNQVCIDLERVFLNSEFKKYFDINKYLLSKVHQTLKSK